MVISSYSFFTLFSSPQLMSSDVNVVFTFSTSLIAFAPSSPISLSTNQWLLLPVICSLLFLTTHVYRCQCGVYFKHFTYCCCSISPNPIVCHYSKLPFTSFDEPFSFPFSLPPRSNDVSVVFTLSTVLIIFAPSFPIPFPVNQSPLILLFIHSFHLVPNHSYPIDLVMSMWCLLEAFHSLLLLHQL